MDIVTGRQITGYRGFMVITGFRAGKCEGAAFNKLLKRSFHAKGTTAAEALKMIEQMIDADVGDNIEKYRNVLIEAHAAFIRSVGKKYQGVRSAPQGRRVNHCYSCRARVDNSYDLECSACNWIVCSNCAACGCGYSGFS